MSKPDATLAELLNSNCECAGTNVPELHRDLHAALGAQGLIAPLLETHPHLFAEAPVFIDPLHVRAMQRIVSAVDATTKLPSYAAKVLAFAPSISHRVPSAAGVFLGFDFHISPEGPKLIEINTNAGGALLNVAARRTQQACCPEVEEFQASQPSADEMEVQIAAMFRREWRLARGERELRSIAIVDDAPQLQFLYPEFLLFKQLFAAQGIEAFIVDAAELRLDNGQLTHAGRSIDLVYNRLTDFYLVDPAHATLRAAYESDAAVITPHPHAHALYSNKRNLTVLSDASILRALDVPGEDIATLERGIPRTRAVEGDESQWWSERKDWFFKPEAGFASRGTYRGNKLTRRVFGEVMKGQYVAQELTPPSERTRAGVAGRETFKVDVRAYVYAGKVQLMAARLYQGQTTNFRTAGGGFAAVYVLNTPRSLIRCITDDGR